MDEEETKSCPNCKREIPAINFTIHSLHCARNIKVCPVCKEPVPSAELDIHHQKLHKLLPCKQCGESVCGTDLEDHIRDSCANTVKCCRFCELELPRRELPAHEGYCGVRTEQCDECKEYVMIKYKQLHLDSNHGFLRLDDDPPPPRKEPPKPNLSRPCSNLNRPTSKQINTRPTSIFDDFTRPSTSDRPNSNLNYIRNGASNTNELTPSTFGMPRNRIAANLGSLTTPPDSNLAGSTASNNPVSTGISTGMASRASVNNPGQNSQGSSGSASNSRINPQNPNDTSDVFAQSSNSVGSNNKPSTSNSRPTSLNRPSNSNSRPSPSSSNARPEPAKAGSSGAAAKVVNNTEIEQNQGSGYICKALASLNAQSESMTGVRTSNGVKKRTNDQPQINTDTSATKTVEKDLGVSRGAVKKRLAPAPPASSRRDLPYYSAVQRQQNEAAQRREQNEYNLAHGLPPVLSPAEKIEKLRKMDALHNREFEEPRRQRRLSPERDLARGHQGHVLGHGVDEATRQEFKNLKPMSPTQFIRRFSALQVSPSAAKSDRIPDIKYSLRELRRGLNEVTAPYNNNNNMASNNNNERVRSPGPLPIEEVQLPCEFCNVLVPADDLVQHQTGCRPDLAQYVPGAVGGFEPPPPPRARRGDRRHDQDRGDRMDMGAHMDRGDPLANGDPVIPCEFCMESLPVYLISEHQEQCIHKDMPV